MVINLNELPPSMLNKAKWARKKILKNPKLAEIDEDELLAWVYNKEDDIWYSINGNYSHNSPQEKMEKRKERIKKQIEWEKKAEKLSLEREVEQKYYSKIRQKILERDNWTCQKCGQKMNKLQVHHVIKTKEGRVDANDNLITLCHKCHKLLDTKEYGLYSNEISTNP